MTLKLKFNDARIRILQGSILIWQNQVTTFCVKKLLRFEGLLSCNTKIYEICYRETDDKLVCRILKAVVT